MSCILTKYQYFCLIKIIDMSENTYLTPECTTLANDYEGVLCSSSVDLPGSNWIGEKEI